MKFEKKQVYYVVIAFTLCFAIQAYWSSGAQLLNTFYTASFPFLMGAGLAYIINIVMSAYEKLYVRLFKNTWLIKLKRSISMILAYLTFTVIIIWIFSIVLPDLIKSLSSLMTIDTKQITKLINELGDNKLVAQALEYLGAGNDLATTIQKYSQQVLKQVLTVLTSLLTSVTTLASTILNLFISLVFSIYVLASKEKLGRQFNLLIDTYLGKFAKTVHYVIGILHQRFHGFFVGQTMEAIILGTLTATGMFIFKLPYAATIGVLVAFTALIPVVGAYIGLCIGFILIATQSITKAIFFVIYLIILQQFEGNLIYPRVVGNSSGLPGMWVLLAITVGGSLWGVLGMLIAVPLSASIYQIIKDHVHKRQTLKVNTKNE
ncbi:AI-2E family transporter [Streptococcus orisratti]|uniref:AI-2E family transporter n=1 Tax=Streptococcus orisratti TaxID=114652 RepID=UPI002A871E59|nr:AI-2E family transporter [Streptococcus orisratti]MDY4002220.1 AI-2E family transporter [Streptococcus orisratti]MDY5635158.1 AI-2E family transporter [Streptococcus orisratti]